MTLTPRHKTLLIFQISAPKTQWVEESRSGSLRPGRRTSRRWTPSSPAPSATTRSPARFLSIYLNCHELNNFLKVKMDKSKHAAKIQCTVCLEDFQASLPHSPPFFKGRSFHSWLSFSSKQATINFLSEPVDVYNEWIDACEAVNNWPFHSFTENLKFVKFCLWFLIFTSYHVTVIIKVKKKIETDLGLSSMRRQ